MSADYRIVAVTGAKMWRGRHGDFVDFYLDIDGYGENVTLTQKTATDDPEPGDTIYGHIEVLERQKKDGTPFQVHKLSKDQRPDFPPAPLGPPQASPQAVGTDNAPVKADSGRIFDARSARIERQHSQEMALRLLTARGDLAGGVPVLDQAKMLVEPVVDWFNADLDAYERARGLSTSEGTEGGMKTPASNGAGEVETPAPTLVPTAQANKLASHAATLPGDRVALELVAAGAKDISNIPRAIHGLTPEGAAKFDAGLDKIAAEQAQAQFSEGHAPPDEGSFIPDSEEIPF